MTTTITTSIALEKTLFSQVETLAQRLNISQDRLFELAIAQFIASHEIDDDQPQTTPTAPTKVINQGDIYWLRLENPSELESDVSHPHVVVQHDVLNHSRINTVVTCLLTSNIKRVNMPGNLLLEIGEANLPKQSVVEVSKVATVAKTQLGDYIGTLSEQRINEIFEGMRFVEKSFFAR